MRRREARIEDTTRTTMWNHYGVDSVKLVMVYDSGWSDTIFLFPNRNVEWIEFKAPGGKIRPAQLENHAKLKKLYDFDVRISESVEDAVGYLVERLEFYNQCRQT